MALGKMNNKSLYLNRLILSVFVLFLGSSYLKAAISEEEIVQNATKISNRVIPTGLKYHQLKQMWFKGDKYCLSGPQSGVGEYTGIYVQILLEKVPPSGDCVFDNEQDVDSTVFVLDIVTKELIQKTGY